VHLFILQNQRKHLAFCTTFCPNNVAIVQDVFFSVQTLLKHIQRVLLLSPSPISRKPSTFSSRQISSSLSPTTHFPTSGDHELLLLIRCCGFHFTTREKEKSWRHPPAPIFTGWLLRKPPWQTHMVAFETRGRESKPVRRQGLDPTRSQRGGRGQGWWGVNRSPCVCVYRRHVCNQLTD